MDIQTPERARGFSVEKPAMPEAPKLKPENDYIAQALRLPEAIRQPLKVWVIVSSVRSFGGREGVPVSINGKKIMVHKDKPTLIPLDYVSVLLNSKTNSWQEKWRLDGSGTYWDLEERMEYPMRIVNDTEYMPVLQAAVNKAMGVAVQPMIGDEPEIEVHVPDEPDPVDIDSMDLTKQTVQDLRKILWTNFRKRPAKTKKKDDLIGLIIKLNEE